MLAPYTLVLVLKPDNPFTEKLLRCKEQVRSLVGNQLYLEDPPHLTIYLSAFAQDVTAEVNNLRKRLRQPFLEVCGWYSFAPDPLTGMNTLVCELREEDRVRLQSLQIQVVEHLSPLRDPGAAQARFEPRRANLSPLEWENVVSYGFPYVGPIWCPHFTVASIHPSDWDLVWKALQSSPPIGPLHCPELVLYRLEAGKPVKMAGFSLT